MKKIDTNEWGEFLVGDLFDIHPTKAYKLTNRDLFDGGPYPVVVNSAYNNGIGGMTSRKPTETGMMITFSDTVDANTIFFQEQDFIGYPHVQGLYPRGEFRGDWARNSLRFFLVAFRKAALTRGFDFGNKFRRDIAVRLTVRLPVTVTGRPDFVYMENYMGKLERQAKLTSDLLAVTPSEVHKVDTSMWKNFHLYDDSLFEIDSGTKLDRVKMTCCNPSVNFIGRANANNGVTDFIDAIPGLKPYDAGLMTISLGGEYLGSCFVQDKPFYTSQNVNVLIPKHPMSDACKRFIGTVIFRESRLHYKAFSDELNRHMKRDFSIPLPALSDGSPDFASMESYMEQARKRVSAAVSALRFT